MTRTTILFLMVMTVGRSFCQPSPTVEVTVNKTATLVFSSVIKSIDRGSRDLLARKAPGVENMLQLKAARAEFPETNLTVVTANGAIHEFTVKYVGRPQSLVSYVDTPGKNQRANLIFETSLTEFDMERIAEEILTRNKNKKWVRTASNKMELSLDGVYIHNDVLFCHLSIVNRSQINYDIKLLRIFIEDATRVKREASQEWEIKPLFTLGNDSLVPGNNATEIVYALEKFTIPDAKQLVIEVFEKNGGRNLRLKARDKHIIKAVAIN